MERFEALPNAFYDAIVYFTPSILLTLGVVVGLGDWFDWSLVTAITSSAVNIIVAVVVIWLLGYEYGRISSALSSLFVQSPLKFLARKTRFFANPNFNRDLVEEVEYLNLDIPKELHIGSKWTIYFYALAVNSIVGSDLLKRYAWEKLSRSSAFTFLLLFSISATWILANRFFQAQIPNTLFSFGTIQFLAPSFFLVLATYYEYYKRNSWNNDLLSKVVPVVKFAGKLAEQKDQYNLKFEEIPEIEIKVKHKR